MRETYLLETHRVSTLRAADMILKSSLANRAFISQWLRDRSGIIMFAEFSPQSNLLTLTPAFNLEPERVLKDLKADDCYWEFGIENGLLSVRWR